MSWSAADRNRICSAIQVGSGAALHAERSSDASDCIAAIAGGGEAEAEAEAEVAAEAVALAILRCTI